MRPNAAQHVAAQCGKPGRASLTASRNDIIRRGDVPTELLQRGDHAPEELVVAEALLLDDGVHGLLARGSGNRC